MQSPNEDCVDGEEDGAQSAAGEDHDKTAAGENEKR
jgi:hypothetical protein